MLRGESERAVAWAVDCVPGNVRTVIPAEGAPPSPRRTPQPPPHPPHDPPYVHYKARMTHRSATFFGRYDRRWPKAGPKALAVAEQPAAARVKSGL